MAFPKSVPILEDTDFVKGTLTQYSCAVSGGKEICQHCTMGWMREAFLTGPAKKNFDENEIWKALPSPVRKALIWSFETVFGPAGGSYPSANPKVNPCGYIVGLNDRQDTSPVELATAWNMMRRFLGYVVEY